MHRRLEIAALSVGVLLVTLGSALLGGEGCAVSTPANSCRVGADCASGVCNEGVCQDPESTSSSGTAGTTSSSSGTSSTGATSSASSGSGGSGVCAPNNDGTITRAEVPLTAGLSAKFLAATNATFATSGTDIGGGQRAWDLGQSFSGDHLSLIETLDPTGQWFAADFSGATYASKLSETNDLLGVFEVTADALLLRGVVSPQDGTQKTELTYTPPVVALSFPLTLNATWSTQSNVTGYAQGVVVAYTENYANQVDTEGTLQTPFAKFNVLRVRTTLVRQIGVIVTTIRSFAFATECFGTVATVTSQNNETNAEFSSVAELRRLSP